jgi:fimbrial chaperone protein
MKTLFTRCFQLLLLAACSLLPVTVSAGSFSVSPIRIELSSAQRSAVLTIRNGGDQPVVVQAQLVDWSQADNEDRLEPTNDLIASPPRAVTTTS